MPELLLRIGEKVREFEGAWSKIANAEARGKGGEMKEDSAVASEFHLVTIRIRSPVRKEMYLTGKESGSELFCSIGRAVPSNGGVRARGHACVG